MLGLDASIGPRTAELRNEEAQHRVLYLLGSRLRVVKLPSKGIGRNQVSQTEEALQLLGPAEPSQTGFNTPGI
jgi:hypothetical protein